MPLHLKAIVHLPFPRFKIFLEGIFWDLFEPNVAAILMESMSEKWVPFRTDLILEKKKSLGARSREYGGCSKVTKFLSAGN